MFKSFLKTKVTKAKIDEIYMCGTSKPMNIIYALRDLIKQGKPYKEPTQMQVRDVSISTHTLNKS